MVAHEYHVSVVKIKLFHHLKVEGVNRTKIKLKGKITFHEKVREQIMHFVEYYIMLQ